ncbi:MAG: hypothetical protein L0Y71_14880 [Gemmataceae bacterium]|nr:hypothetical protein [Gemmataceae bacterium]
MSQSTTAPDPADAILSKFLADYEAATDPEATLRDWCDRHPELAARFRSSWLMLVMSGGDVAGAAIIAAGKDLINPIHVGFLLRSSPGRFARSIRKADMDLNVTAFREFDRFRRSWAT